MPALALATALATGIPRAIRHGFTGARGSLRRGHGIGAGRHLHTGAWRAQQDANGHGLQTTPTRGSDA